MADWIKIGEVPIDTGRLCLGDPCQIKSMGGFTAPSKLTRPYTPEEEEELRETEFSCLKDPPMERPDWNTFDALMAKGEELIQATQALIQDMFRDRLKQGKWQGWRQSRGIFTVQTGVGDGAYPIYIKYSEEGDVAAVMVNFYD